ncbi:MAG: DUF1592 domain-containing protein [Planctomycetota bacterium]
MRFTWLVLAAIAAPSLAGESFVEEYCMRCHVGRKAKGGIDVEKLRPTDWYKLRRQLRARTMPPETAERPAEDEYAAALRWVEAELKKAAPPEDPGRVTVRRLNRAEYENTIRDLLGVDFDARARFPADEVGHGFDNVGDVLGLPPLLLEKYLDAAEEIARRAIVDLDPTHPPTVRRTGDRLLRRGKGGGARGRVMVLWAPDEAYFSHRFPREGDYILRGRAFGWQAGDEVVRMALRLDGRRVDAFDVHATMTAPGTYEARVRVTAGRHRVGMAFINDYYNPKAKDPRQRDRNSAVLHLEVVGPLDKQRLGAAQRWLTPRGRGALGAGVKRLLDRAFRRPATEGEVKAVLRVVDASAPRGASFEARLRIAIAAALVSPNFLFRLEPGEESRPLDDFELASRLSYFLWSSMPDEELFRAARTGRLSEPDGPYGLVGQARRMLKDARATALAQNFATQWLRIRDLEQRATPDPGRFAGVDGELLAAMEAETVLFFDAVMREDRGIGDLLDADFTFVNERLARHYGLPGVRGALMRRVRGRGGLLDHASVLTVTSNPTRTSPVKRGKWILEALLDAPPPAPPPGLDGLDADGKAKKGLTLRQRFEQHRADPRCASCHVQMDALGYGLETYDAVGRPRTTENGLPIDSSGTLPDGRTFDGPAELRAVLKKDPAFPRALSKHLLAYALGRGVADADEPALERCVKALEQRPTLRRLVEEIVTLDAFRMRKGEG